jgi:hypothetical protein
LKFGWTSCEGGRGDIESVKTQPIEIANGEDAEDAVEDFSASPAQLPPPKIETGGSAGEGKPAVRQYEEDKGCFGFLGNLWYTVFNFFNSLQSQEGVRYVAPAFIVAIWGVLPFSTSFYVTWKLDWIMFSAIIVLAIPSVTRGCRGRECGSILQRRAASSRRW